MTPAQLSEGEALLAAAAAGKWKVIVSPHGPRYTCVQYGNDPMYASLEMEPEDAELIVWLRNNAPALIAALREAQRDAEIVKAARNLVAVKGRHHSQQAYEALVAAIDAARVKP